MISVSAGKTYTSPFQNNLGQPRRNVTNNYNLRSVDFIFSAIHEGAMAAMSILSMKGHNIVPLILKSLGMHEFHSLIFCKLL